MRQNVCNLMKLSLFIILIIMACEHTKAQSMDYEECLKIVNADYGVCYRIGNYELCPEKKLIKRGGMFGTATIDCFGFFPDSTLVYGETPMIIFGGQVFFDQSDFDINWQTAKLLSHTHRKALLSDKGVVYELESGYLRKSTRSNNVYPEEEKRKSRPGRKELGENYYVSKNKFYYDGKEISEPFDVPNLHIVKSKDGYETYFASDGKQLIFCGFTGGYSTTSKNGKEYVTVKDLIINNVDFPTLRVLGKDLLMDKNAIYYRTDVVPFDELEGFKFIIREL